MRYSGGSGRESFQDTEADTGKIDPRVVMFTKLARTLDHFPLNDVTAFVELAEALVDMNADDRRTVFTLASRLSK